MNKSSIIMYTTEDGLTKIETTFDEDTVWLSLDQMAELFQRDKSTISRHIKNIFQEGELVQSSTVAKFATVQTEGTRTVERNIDYYNLDVIISVGLLSAVFVLGKGMFLGFYSTDPDVLYYAEQRLIIATTLELLTAVYEISAGAMRGLGHSLLPAIITVVGSCVLRLIWL